MDVPDHVFNILTELGAAAAVLGLIGGVAVAFFYGRKVNAQVAGRVHRVDDGSLVIVARPSIHCPGFRGLEWGGRRWQTAILRVTEVCLASGSTVDGYFWEMQDVFERSRVAGGETLCTSVLVPLGEQPPDYVIGWRVSFVGTARRWWFWGWAWEDRAFVPLIGTPEASSLST